MSAVVLEYSGTIEAFHLWRLSGTYQTLLLNYLWWVWEKLRVTWSGFLNTDTVFIIYFIARSYYCCGQMENNTQHWALEWMIGLYCMESNCYRAYNWVVYIISDVGVGSAVRFIGLYILYLNIELPRQLVTGAAALGL